MSNKTPYEIRSDLIQLATEHLQKQYQANIEFAKSVYEHSIKDMPQFGSGSVEKAIAFQNTMMENISKFVPVAPTIDEITKKATELYSFVTKKD